MTRGLGSTYRLQLNGLGLEGARRQVAYLHRLGIETLYVSPLLAASPGSTHGYDVVDPTRIDPGLGTPADLEALLVELDAHSMRLLIDIVPNHLAATADNPWWWETLRTGRNGPHARVFDIDWSAHGGRVLLPVLGRPLGQVLAAGELSLETAGTEPVLAYFDSRFPLDPATVGEIPGGGASPADLERLLDGQHYRLAYWRLGRRQGNYRRFFDIDGLVGVRVEDPEVYRATHVRILELAADPRVAGLRVDHIDGLADPGSYLDRLSHDLDRARRETDEPAVLLVEKILARSEYLPVDWPVDGTTGYEFADLAGGLAIDPAPADSLFDAFVDMPFRQLATQAKRDVMADLFPGQVERVAREVVEAIEARAPDADLDPADAARAVVELTAQLDVYRTYLGTADPGDRDCRRLWRAASRARGYLDAEGRRALGLLVDGLSAGFPDQRWSAVCLRWQQLTGAVAAKGVEDTALYRITGLPASAEVGGDPDRPAVEPGVFHRAMQVRSLRQPDGLNATSTHDTKRSEDVRARLAALTEWKGPWAEQVARWERRHREELGDYRMPSRSDEHLIYATTTAVWPPGGADLPELASRIREYVVKAAREAKLRTSWSEPDEEYEETLAEFVEYLVGTGGSGFVGEVETMVAAIGPAAAVNGLVATVLKMTAPGVPDVYQGTETWSQTLVDPDNRRPVDFAELARMLAGLDGAEDSVREDSVREDGTARQPWLESWADGRVKLDVTRRLLGFRRDNPGLFSGSGYLPLEVHGSHSDHLVSFARREGDAWSITVVPRLVLSLVGPGRLPIGAELWAGDTVELPPDAPTDLVDILSGGRCGAPGGVLRLDRVLAGSAVAVLVAGVVGQGEASLQAGPA